MPETAYPLLRAAGRRRKRRRWPRPTRAQVRGLAALILVLAIAAGVKLARRPRVQPPAELIADARAALARGNVSAARRSAERAAADAPRSAAAALLLAQADLRLDWGVAAEAAAGRAAALGATGVAPLLAEARLEQGDAAGALQALPPGPDDAAAGRVRGLALAAQGQGEAAQRLLIDAAARAPGDGQAATALGRLRLEAGELGGAAAAAAEAVRRDRNDPAALTLAGEVVRARYGVRAALPWFAAAVRRDAYYPPALIQQAATLAEAGRTAGALAATRAVLLARPGDPRALYLQAVIAARAGRTELARRLLAAADGGLDELPGALLLQGAIDEAAGRHEQAAAAWRRLLARQPMNLAVRRLVAAATLRAGDGGAALELLRPLALRADADAGTLTVAARAAERTGDRGLAAALLDRAGRGTAPGGAFASDEPVAALVADARGAPGDPTYAVGLIRGRLGAVDGAGALAGARQLAAAAPGDPAAELALGDVLAATGDWRAAALVYARAADLQFDEPTALRLIDALGRAGRAHDAAAALALYLGQNPQSLAAARLLGHWQAATGDPGAVATLERVRRRLGGRDAALLADLARAHAAAGDGARARTYGAAAYRLQPLSADACQAYAVALAAAGDRDGAAQLRAKLLTLPRR